MFFLIVLSLKWIEFTYICVNHKLHNSELETMQNSSHSSNIEASLGAVL